MNNHGGNIRYFKSVSEKENIIDFSSNINPLGLQSWIKGILQRSSLSLNEYPDIEYREVRELIANYYRLKIENLTLVNGISEALFVLPKIYKQKKAILLSPSFNEYKRGLRNFKIEQLNTLKISCIYQSIKESLSKEDGIVYINNPQNPTGKLYSNEKILNLCSQYKNSLFVIDESFLNFTKLESLAFSLNKYNNLIVLKSYTKDLAIPGIRIGAVFASESISNLLIENLPSWNVNSIGIEIIKEFYSQDIHSFKKQLSERTLDLREHFKKGLTFFPISMMDTESNFCLLEFKKKDALKVHDFLLKKEGIATRTCEDFEDLDHKKYLRVSMKNEKEQNFLFKSLEKFYQLKKIKQKKKTPSIMIQGTTSNAGKSLIATGLCRIFQEDGVNVSPFKSQNMALNSYVTQSCGEIGRAQAVQALACKKDASILMNPILLKPNSENTSQVILNGKPLEHMNFKDYFSKKLEYFEDVKKSYDKLCEDSELVVIEGAGSPAEINLKSRDIVNMNMAKYADANVYLCADIDRGGMFASFLGTFHTFHQWEHNLVKGMIINRFRGDKSLLNPGIEYLEKNLLKPVLGCIPNIDDHQIPEEDCIEFKSGAFNDNKPLGDRIDIAVIDTPRISNFTDIDPLRGEKDIRIRMVSSVNNLGCPDIVLFCGSKSVVKDLKFLKESGLSQKLLELYREKNTCFVGICGGYQFLSHNIFDPNNIESEEKCFSGLNLLDLDVEMKKQKTLKQVSGTFLPWNQKIEGYEIHHGESTELSTKIKPIVRNNNNSEILGYSTLDGKCWGTYVHGIFDNDEFRHKFLNYHRKRIGKNERGGISFEYNVDQAISSLASTLRNSLNMKKIYSDLNL